MLCTRLVEREILKTEDLSAEPLHHFDKILPALGVACSYGVAQNVSKALEMFLTSSSIRHSEGINQPC